MDKRQYIRDLSERLDKLFNELPENIKELSEFEQGRAHGEMNALNKVMKMLLKDLSEK